MQTFLPVARGNSYVSDLSFKKTDFDHVRTRQGKFISLTAYLSDCKIDDFRKFISNSSKTRQAKTLKLYFFYVPRMLSDGKIRPSQPAQCSRILNYNYACLKEIVLLFYFDNSISDKALTDLGRALAAKANLVDVNLNFSIIRRMPTRGIINLINQLGKLNQLEKIGLGFSSIVDIDNKRLVSAITQLLAKLPNLKAVALGFDSFSTLPNEVSIDKATLKNLLSVLSRRNLATLQLRFDNQAIHQALIEDIHPRLISCAAQRLTLNFSRSTISGARIKNLFKQIKAVYGKLSQENEVVKYKFHYKRKLMNIVSTNLSKDLKASDN